MSALRFNEGKPMVGYVLEFPAALKALARVMEFGACKYDDGNWKKGGKPDSEYINSALRHLLAWKEGKEYDEDSACSHLGHAVWNLMALIELNHPENECGPNFRERCEHWGKKESH